MNIVDLGQIGYTLQQSLTNLQQFQDQYFDIFINPQPMMVNIQNIDPTTGEIVNLTIPNFAQLQLQVAQWVQSENGTGGYMYLPSVHIAGDLFVDGNSIVLDSSTMNVGDSFIELNTNMTSGQGITDAGMMVYRGSENPVMLFWNEQTDSWQITDNTETQNIVIENTNPTLETLTLTSPIIQSSQATTKSYVDNTSSTLQNEINNTNTNLNNTSTVLQNNLNNTSTQLQNEINNTNTNLNNTSTELTNLIDNTSSQLQTNLDNTSTELTNLIDNTSSTLNTDLNNTSTQLENQIQSLNSFTNSLQNQINNLNYLYVATSSNTVFTVNHNLNSQYVNVTCYNSANNTLILPNSVVAIDANNISISFTNVVKPIIRITV